MRRSVEGAVSCRKKGHPRLGQRHIIQLPSRHRRPSHDIRCGVHVGRGLLQCLMQEEWGRAICERLRRRFEHPQFWSARLIFQLPYFIYFHEKCQVINSDVMNHGMLGAWQGQLLCSPTLSFRQFSGWCARQNRQGVSGEWKWLQERLQHLHRDGKAMERSDIRSLLKLLSHYPMTQWWWFGAQDFVVAPGEPCTKLHPFWPSNLLHLTGVQYLGGLVDQEHLWPLQDWQTEPTGQSSSRIVLQMAEVHFGLRWTTTRISEQCFFCSVWGGYLQFSNMCLHAACQEPFCLPMMPGKLSVASPVLDSFPQKTRGFGMWPS